MDFSDELQKESSIKTLYPSFKSKRQVCEPIKPAPPVTKIANIK